MQPIVPEYRRVLVDVLHGELHRGHDAAPDVALRHVVAIREEAGDVDVALLAAAEIDRLLAGALANQQEPAGTPDDHGQQRQRATRPVADRRRRRQRHGDFPGRPHPVRPLHPVSPDDISRRARFHLAPFRVTKRKPADDKPSATLIAARPSASALMTRRSTPEVDSNTILERDSPRACDRFVITIVHEGTSVASHR